MANVANLRDDLFTKNFEPWCMEVLDLYKFFETHVII